MHGPKNFGVAFAVGTLLKLALVAAQLVYGIHAHSIALITDAGHNFGDTLGLLLAWIAYILARWGPTEQYTYGFRSASILAALANATILLIATGAIVSFDPAQRAQLDACQWMDRRRAVLAAIAMNLAVVQIDRIPT